MYKAIVDHNPSQSELGEQDKEFSIFLKSDLGKVFGGMQAIENRCRFSLMAMKK